MKNQLVQMLILISATTLNLVAGTKLTLAENPVQYSCINYQGNPMTIADTPRGKIPLISWKSTFFTNGGYTPEQRCQAVTARFQQHADAGSLRYVDSGTINKQPVICVVERTNSPTKPYKCKQDGLLLTLEPKDNPKEVLKTLFDVSSRVSNGAITRGGVINIEDFLQNAPTMKESDSLPSSGNFEDFDGLLFNNQQQ
ncbi:hypothetical protein Sta7437_2647 [Stanieria cyanosphaera PCC 7437]|uniref:Circadian oscillating protein COP23 n=1 Tax=Stanieria cyanosphaera (strain ATCC 29371 / PCC 7437) TaxID=111780 RepID=K9XVR5_STAC7|nr:COP23 domain-containing protein [Stanieria cyanosphaera]AFZ36176.1 hypothetical protein Sta7437_2647 [Stanieria cyanosphaera PCC 7437]